MPLGSIGSFYDGGNVKVGSAVGFIAPDQTPEADESVTVFDPAVWVDPWVSAGATEQGWQVSWNPQTQDINIDEQPTPVDQQMTTATLQFIASLMEDTVQSWAWALNADKTVVAPGTGIFGKTVLTPSGTLKRYAATLETQTVNDMPRRYYAPSLTAAAQVTAQFQRAAAARMVPLTFTTVCNIDEITVTEITAAAT
jgi:hypothetical protein